MQEWIRWVFKSCCLLKWQFLNGVQEPKQSRSPIGAKINQCHFEASKLFVKIIQDIIIFIAQHSFKASQKNNQCHGTVALASSAPLKIVITDILLFHTTILIYPIKLSHLYFQFPLLQFIIKTLLMICYVNTTYYIIGIWLSYLYHVNILQYRRQPTGVNSSVDRKSLHHWVVATSRE